MSDTTKSYKDPDVFPDTYKFNPERFIKDSAIDTALANQVLVFSAGARRCIGEAFAKQEMFVIVLNIIQDLIVELDPDQPESLRFACTVAFIMPHTATADVQLREWNIPKGTQFVANVWKAHKDPMIFPEPYKFNPERFIKDGAIDTTLANQVLVFSAELEFNLCDIYCEHQFVVGGGRRCIGEAFAKQEIFVIVLNIIQDLIVELDPGFLHFKFNIEGC